MVTSNALSIRIPYMQTSIHIVHRYNVTFILLPQKNTNDKQLYSIDSTGLRRIWAQGKKQTNSRSHHPPIAACRKPETPRHRGGSLFANLHQGESVVDLLNAIQVGPPWAAESTTGAEVQADGKTEYGSVESVVERCWKCHDLWFVCVCVYIFVHTYVIMWFYIERITENQVHACHKVICTSHILWIMQIVHIQSHLQYIQFTVYINMICIHKYIQIYIHTIFNPLHRWFTASRQNAAWSTSPARWTTACRLARECTDGLKRHITVP